MSSTASFKESTLAVNNKKDAHFNPTYVLSTGNVNIKPSSNKSTSADVEKKPKTAYFSKNIVLNTSTADLKSSSEYITKDLQKKRDAFFTTICIVHKYC